MSLLISTQSYRNDVPSEFGYLLQMNQETGAIEKIERIDTPVICSNSGERMKSGLRGVWRFKGRIYTCSWNKVFILDESNFSVTEVLSHKWMSDNHGIHVTEEGIWLTSSLPDAVILYDFNAKPISSLWFTETRLYQNPATVDRDKDWSQRGKNFRGFKEFHANNVTVHENHVYVTGRGDRWNVGRVIRVPKSHFLEKEYLNDEDYEVFASKLHGPHDGRWSKGKLYLTETEGSTLAELDDRGRLVSRKIVKEFEQERIQYSSPRERLKFLVKKYLFRGPGQKTTHWTRGLAIANEHLYVGQSTMAGDTESRARVVRINRGTGTIDNCFYLKISEYPETRIFQLEIIP